MGTKGKFESSMKISAKLRQGFPTVILLLFLVLVTIQVGEAVWLDVPPTGTKCVSEEIHSNVVVLGDYIIISEDHSASPTISVKKLQCISIVIVVLIYKGHIYPITIGLSDLINTKKCPISDDLLHLMIWDDSRSRTDYNEDVFSAGFNTYVDDLAIPSTVVWSMLKKAASLGLGHGLLKCLTGILVTRLNQTFEFGFATVHAELNLPT